MEFPIYQVDAFSSRVFAGNPAAVCVLDRWLPDAALQAVAAENNVSETAFLVPAGEDFEIRWFTPAVEVALCGHATLASAFVLFVCRHWTGSRIRFRSRFSGVLPVTQRGDCFDLDFPARAPLIRRPPLGLAQALGADPLSVLGSAEDLLVVLEDEDAVKAVRPDFDALEKVDCRGVIVTAKGDQCDFVSRFFAPRVGVKEDPVTGSAHCVLIPYWCGVLGKLELQAVQVSRRGGELSCALEGERVRISGQAALYLEGRILI